MRVVLIEDDPRIAQCIAMLLRSDGYVCDIANFGEDGLEIGELYDYDIILLVLKLPDSTSYQVLHRLRAARVRTPTLILSSLSLPDDKLKELGVSAGDVLSFPFNKRELIGRIHSVIERTKERSDSIVKTGKLTVDLDAHTAKVGGEPLPLTAKEYRILELLAAHKNTTLTKEIFLNQLYGGMDEPELKIIDVFVCKLRKKLAQATGGETYIETIWGRGYALRDPVQPLLEIRQSQG